jgi:hypothetical protein
MREVACPPLDFPKFLNFFIIFPLFFNIPRKLCKSKFDFDFDFDLVVVDLAPKRFPVRQSQNWMQGTSLERSRRSRQEYAITNLK